ncbi:MAG: thiamine-phosphate kinase [Bacteroidales bacterium]|jgi:thiamine-monophosphate kinase|nr:thiamine-phosphate kinase [Bacteroidales bacterium]
MRSISQLGKFGLIAHLTENIRKGNKSTISDIGDDSAIIDSGGQQVLVSTDLILEGIHFSLVYTPLKHLGYKAVLRAVSDIWAMNGKPEQILVSVGMGSRFRLENIEELYEGIKLACDKYKVDLAGGDMTSSFTGLTIGVTAVGSAPKDSIVKRSGAAVNDLICVSGNFGAAYLGLQILEREKKMFEKEKVAEPDFSGYEYLIGRQLKPEFPVSVLEELERAGIRPSSMIDVTEGLASDLISICKHSSAGCTIYYSRIPVDYETAKAAEEFNIDPVTAALNGGEDYELLFTIPVAMHDRVSGIKDVSVIGHISGEAGSYILAGDDGSEIRLKAQGWNTAE